MKRKNYLLILLLCILFSSCETVKNLNDYDSVTYEKKDYLGREILGTVKVSTLGFTWSKYNPQDPKTMKLMSRLEQKAINKYGENIEILDVEIGSMDGLTTSLLWGAGGAGFMGGVLSSTMFTEEVVKNEGRYNEEKEREITNQDGYMASMGIGLGSLVVFLFKGVKATAVVVKSDVPYKKGTYQLISEDEIIERQNKYEKNKYEIDKERKMKERESKLESDKELFYNLRNQVIVRGKDVNSPIVILNKGVSKINSAGGVNCYVEFINTSGKLAKYVNIDLTPYNRVFDKAYSQIDGSSTKTLTVTNFIGPNDSYLAAWESVWYNTTIMYVEVSKVEMIFADNTKLVIDNQNDLKKIEFTGNEQIQYSELERSIKDK